MKYTESDLERATLEWFVELGYSVVGGPEIAPPPDGEKPERANYLDVVLVERLKCAIAKFNPEIPEEAKEESATESPSCPYNQSQSHRQQ